jgi:hypothetical protein
VIDNIDYIEHCLHHFAGMVGENCVCSDQKFVFICLFFICQLENVVGYDLNNESFTIENSDQHWYDVENGGEPPDKTVLPVLFEPLIKAIRARDQVTPIIIELPFWAHISALHHHFLPIE